MVTSRATTRHTRRVVPALLAGVALTWAAAAPASGPPRRVEGEAMTVSAGRGHVVRDLAATGRRALALDRGARATASLGLASRARLALAVRAGCATGSRLTASADGSVVLSRAVRGGGWHVIASGPLGPGAHRVSVRAGGGCPRPVRVDRLWLAPLPGAPSPTRPAAPRGAPEGVGATPVPASPAGGAAAWHPGPGTTWQWQLTTPVDQSVAAQLYDIDLFDNPASVVASLHARGRRVLCYMEAGAYEPGRPDSAQFPAAALGADMAGWPGERWLDIRRIDLIGPILERRLDLCRAKGFDGVEPDNVEGWGNPTGFPLTAADQIAFNRWLARAAHARGLAVALKNDLSQAAALAPDFDLSLVEECFQFQECGLAKPFLDQGKAVLVAEYALPASAFCVQARALGVMAMRATRALDGTRETCW